MSDPRLFVCGGLDARRLPRDLRHGTIVTPLQIGRRRTNVHLDVEHLTLPIGVSLPDLLTDLLELATYVYAADQAATRGGTRSFDYGDRWRRDMRFAVPVRRPDVWTRPEVRRELEGALQFLSDEPFTFHFVPHPCPPAAEQYVTDGVRVGEAPGYDEVVLFSGGLDSLGGAIDEILVGQRKVALVSHRPVNNMYARQRDLVAAITYRLPDSRLKPLHVAVEVNKSRALDQEHTQRTRSFLFAAVAAIVARQLGRDRIRFYENGVTSLNLPICGELVGSLASRTTHPQTLARFGRMFSLLFDTTFTVQNPFQWSTKADGLRRLRGQGHADLCVRTSSCVHTRELTDGFTHCGACSQCVDRRLAALTAGLSPMEDDPELYSSDVVLGARTGPALTLVERYTGFAGDLEGITDAAAFAAAYPEVNRAVPFLGMPAAEGQERIFRLYERHAAELRATIPKVLAAHTEVLARQTYPANSLLGVVVGRVAAPRLPAAALRPQGSLPSERGWILDREQFEVRFDGRSCGLGNTIEFRLLTYLFDRRDRYVSVDAIRAAVWEDDMVAKNTVQKAVSNLRRRLRGMNPDGIVIDGDRQDAYRLRVVEAVAAPVAS